MYAEDHLIIRRTSEDVENVVAEALIVTSYSLPFYLQDVIDTKVQMTGAW